MTASHDPLPEFIYAGAARVNGRIGYDGLRIYRQPHHLGNHLASSVPLVRGNPDAWFDVRIYGPEGYVNVSRKATEAALDAAGDSHQPDRRSVGRAITSVLKDAVSASDDQLR